MITKLNKWGNSLAIRLPKSITKKSNIDRGSTVDISYDDQSIIITPIEHDKLILCDMLSEITDENRHELLLTDKPQGKEQW